MMDMRNNYEHLCDAIGPAGYKRAALAAHDDALLARSLFRQIAGRDFSADKPQDPAFLLGLMAHIANERARADGEKWAP